MTRLFFLLILLSSLVACVDDRDFMPDETALESAPEYGDLVLNEIAPAGTELTSQYGENADWFELYNASENDIILMPQLFFFTDDVKEPSKYSLPQEVMIAAGEHLLFWCDNHNTITEHIHTNFKLSENGEELAIFVRQADGNLVELDAIVFPEVAENKSYGRMEDGAAEWTILEETTPNQPN